MIKFIHRPHSSSKKAMDMIHGPLIKNIVIFSIPVILTGILQLFYNATDIIVVGQFAEGGSIGAVGATTPIINLIVNFFMGFSVGACVTVARYFGARDENGVSRAVHTSILLAAICGVFVAIFGFFTTRAFLEVMATPSDIIDRSTIYMQIFYLGSPFNLVYNFGAGILRAVGETKKPLYYLMISGVVNVALNLFFVIVFGLGVAGVAIATITSQVISCVLVVICLMRSFGPLKLYLNKLRLHKRELLEIIRMGLPAGIQSSLFSLSNLLIQSSVNSFGSAVVEGNSAAGSIDSFIYTSMNGVSQASITFVSQNYGARNFKRIPKAVLACCGVATAAWAILGGLIYLFRDPIIGIYITTSAPLETARLRLDVFCALYFGCGIMEVMAGALRGLNYSITPMVISLVGVCAFRIVWIYTIFTWYHSMFVLYMSYPVTWVITITADAICFAFAMKKIKKRNMIANQIVEKT